MESGLISCPNQLAWSLCLARWLISIHTLSVGFLEYIDVSLDDALLSELVLYCLYAYMHHTARSCSDS